MNVWGKQSFIFDMLFLFLLSWYEMGYLFSKCLLLILLWVIHRCLFLSLSLSLSLNQNILFYGEALDFFLSLW